ncbi:hypothetical protein INT47_004361 [Mucor saturninus]|uniref:BZIP domain-containing protein n=1 Tax=Mucor saturninus TaxID=64648 RepID=A0A8H7UY07_9FUNG|nr:hypothetical protein INT47_004361 [Mucor saturninus]
MSYISSLNLLGDDSPVPLSEEALSEELAIWANAQFTFDTKPGSAIVDDSYKAVAEQQNIFSTFENLNPQNNTDLLHSYLNNTPYLIPSPQQQQQQQQQPQNILPRIAPAPSTINHSQLLVGKKRPLPSITRKEEEETTEIVEEDKRKRNTAASARFRMKKKLREQALEQTAKEMTAKAEALEKRVIELEKEAKWLRALVVEKDPALLSTD